MIEPTAAIEQLTNHQQQADMDGCFVTVSRQALEEVLDYLRTPPASQSDEALVEIARIVRDRLEDGGGCVDGPDWDWDVDECAKVAEYALFADLTGSNPAPRWFGHQFRERDFTFA